MKFHNIPKSPITGVIYGKEVFWDETDEQYGARNARMNLETEEYIRKAVNYLNMGETTAIHLICPECGQEDGYDAFEDFHTRYEGTLLIGCEGYHFYADDL